MNIDSAFYTGKTHAVCQDYARTNDEKGYMILADGCSGSPDTDVGARLLVLGAEKAFSLIHNNFPYGEFETRAMTYASAMADACGTHSYALDATLLVGSTTNDVAEDKLSVYVQVIGDGVVVVKRKDGTYRIYWVDYAEGYPFYLNYTLEKSRYSGWEAKAKKNVTVHHLIVCNDKWEVIKQYRSDYKPKTSYMISFDEPSEQEKKAQKEDSENIIPRDMHFDTHSPRGFNVYSPVDETEWVAMMSDGVLTFNEKSKEPSKPNQIFDLPTVLKELLDFRNYGGTFVKRQVNWFLKEAAKRNWQHDDDLSVAVMYVG